MELRKHVKEAGELVQAAWAELTAAVAELEAAPLIVEPRSSTSEQVQKLSKDTKN